MLQCRSLVRIVRYITGDGWEMEGAGRTNALMNSLGPMIQATRQPGRRKRLVRPSMISTSSSSTSMTFSFTLCQFRYQRKNNPRLDLQQR